MDNTRQTIRQFLKELMQRNNDDRPFADAESLIVSGRLQSMEVLEIVVFLEERFGLDFSDGFDQSWLDSVDEILTLLSTLSTK